MHTSSYSKSLFAFMVLARSDWITDNKKFIPLIQYLKIETFVASNPVIIVFHEIGCREGIYLVCWVMHVIYYLITDPLFRALSAIIKLPVIDAES